MSESEIYREVDEELRHENMVRLWKRFGPYAIAVAVAVAAITASMVGWKEYTTARSERWGSAFGSAMTDIADEKFETAAQAFAALGDESSGGYQTIARFQEAALLARQGNVEGAQAIYAILETDAVDQAFRDMAVLMSVYYSLDSQDPEILKSRLAPLTIDGNPWHFSALELTGFLAVRTGDTALVKDVFTRLSENSAAPVGIRARAGEMLAVIGE